MAFCGNCGTALNGGTTFCSSCGALTAKASQAGVLDDRTTGSGVTAVRKAGMTPAVKIVLGLLCAFLLVALLGVGAIFYSGYRIHQKAQEVSQIAADGSMLLHQIAKALPDSGANTLPSPGGQASGSSSQPSGANQRDAAPPKLDTRHITEKDGQCAVFTKEELTQVLGDTFTHADADATGCTYKGDAPRQWVRTEILWAGGKAALLQRKEAYADLARNMPKANIPIQPYPNAGDEAFVNLWNCVQARKGNVAVTVDLRYYHDNDSITRMLVNAAVDRVAGT
jgi:hypothetical protein